jgi:hypothetical protein
MKKISWILLVLVVAGVAPVNLSAREVSCISLGNGGYLCCSLWENGEVTCAMSLYA